MQSMRIAWHGARKLNIRTSTPKLIPMPHNVAVYNIFSSMTSKRPLSDLSYGVVATSSHPSHHIKKVKVGDASAQDSLLMNIDPIHTDLRTAIDIKKALDHVHHLEQLGYCPTKVQKFRTYFGQTTQTKGVQKILQVQTTETSAQKISRVQISPTRYVILDKLQTVSEDMKSLSTSYTYGEFENSSFKLRITRPGCNFNDAIGTGTDNIDSLLPIWFDHSAISGYGDMQSLETKVDSDVRNAREIPASEFEIKPEFLKKIQNMWGKHFLPRTVRAEPYKIHLYGPGGHFKSHRDTPETGLVGTFLVGLGDTSSTSEGNFRIGDKTLSAKRNTWVAFHPDVPHEVTKMEDGYRAVVAFKIFRVDGSERDVLPAQLEGRLKQILDKNPAPFGLLTGHQYSIGTTSPNGFDALLMAYARSRNDIQARMLPVVIDFSAEAYDYPEVGESYIDSSVYPFTRAHVDILLKKNVDRAEKEVEWLVKYSDIPFYAWDFASLEAWKEEYPDGAKYTGNAAASQREDSVYLSHAILFLPETPNDPHGTKTQ